ncbi:MAG: type II toxin-antitoxin system HipA family toxin [Sphaerochaetaceae bacterium]|nr:type II toxin-antitoxin system HipA family toxin [Spirochaetales bacterium]MDY5498812.1 type II toxin-antitoxin system HipA family toxin [Sphaerochaetaceae bacterium]
MTSAYVVLWGTIIGSVVFDERRKIGIFEYDPAFRTSRIEVSPIVMPLSARRYEFPQLRAESFHGLPGLLADSLPDKFGNAVIDAWLAHQGRSPQSFNPVERLCYTGSRGMGALEYVPARGPDPRESQQIEIDRLVELATKVLQARKGMHVVLGTDSLEEIIKVGSSAGGARAKAVIAWNETTGDIRSGQLPAGIGYGNWLMKFDGVDGNGDKDGDDGPQYTRIEYAYYLMALASGIDMSECRLLDEGGRRHFMTRRFDRDMRTGDKIHMQTLGALAHFDFNVSGAYSYEDAARIMRRLRLPYTDMERLFRRMVFNVLAWNHDDHVKNLSFLMDRNGTWSLAPAYDVTYAYKPDSMWVSSHQMTINGKQSDIGLRDLLAAGANMGIRESRARSIVIEVKDGIGGWDGFAKSAGLSMRVAGAIGAKLLESQRRFSRELQAIV